VKTEVSRITLDVPKKIHKKFKALAASKGKSMKEMLVTFIDKQLEAQKDDECPYSHTPNKKTIKAIKDSYNKKNLVECKDMEDLIKKLSR
jgi:hypothetical protein